MGRLTLALLFASCIFGQTGAPNCQFAVQFTGNGNLPAGNGSAAFSTPTGTPCVAWRVSYESPTTVTALTITLQGAPDNAGTAGSFVTYAGSVDEGSNPMSTIQSGSFDVRPGTSGVYYPWVRINLSGYMGSGTVSVKAYGYQGTSSGPGGGGGPTSNVNVADVGGVPVTTTDGNLGTDAGQTARTGAAWTSGTAGNTAITLNTYGYTTIGQSFNPSGSITGGVVTFEVSDDGGATYYSATCYRLGTSGADSTYAFSGAAAQFWQCAVGGTTQYRMRLSTTISGAGTANVGITAVNGQAHIDNVTAVQPGQSLGQSDGLSNTEPIPFVQVNGANSVGFFRNLPFRFNGSTWDRDFICTSQALFNLSGSGDTQIIAASGSTVIRVCHISFSTTAAEDVQIEQGTGSNCGTNNAVLTGLYKSVQSMALDFTPNESLRTTTGGRALCINQSGTQALGGVVVYAQY